MNIDKIGNNSYQFIIFGGTGDLAHRKILPAFYNLTVQGLLPANLNIIAIGRRYDNEDVYCEEIYKAVKKFSRFQIKDEHWQKLRKRITYQQTDIKEEAGYKKLKKQLASNSRKIFYLAVAPEFFDLIVQKLDKHNIVGDSNIPSRLVIEKPFGRDLKSASELNYNIREVFPENNIYRIDHYLGKEMLQNIMVIRFANLLFEPLWNHKYIDNVQIISNESAGVGDRAGYYDQAGALRDMVQNHMLQLLTLTAMEPPADMDTDSIRNEKVKILKSLKIDTENIKGSAVRGQYGQGKVDGKQLAGYREEENTAEKSSTETFAAMKVYVNNLRWSGVPFYIRTGKRLQQKSTEVIVEFKSNFLPSYLEQFTDLQPNLLVIKIQPREGVFLQFNAKKPGNKLKIVPVKMDYCQNCQIGVNSPEAYERLVYDILRGDQTLFTRWDEVKHSWQFVDQIADAWEKVEPDFPNYISGSTGPKAADELLERDGRKWWLIDTDNIC
ncbi:MAG: glucose-6-phosphate dehydrogenase [Halothermotrichaceae bacterium]